MSIKSATSANPTGDSTLTRILDNRYSRWSIGRVDSIGRVAMLITGLAIQGIKIIGKSILVGLSLNAWKYVEGCEALSSYGLKLDVTVFGITAYRCAKAFGDILAAPEKNYSSTPMTAFNVFKMVLGGDYHNKVRYHSDKNNEILSIDEIKKIVKKELLKKNYQYDGQPVTEETLDSLLENKQLASSLYPWDRKKIMDMIRIQEKNDRVAANDCAVKVTDRVWDNMAILVPGGRS